MPVIRITESQLTERMLDFIGSSFFSGERLQRFIQTKLASLSSVAQIDLPSLTQGGNRITEVWGIFENYIPLGGMTMNYYLSEKLSKQLYFCPIENEQGEIEAVTVESFSEIVSRKLSPMATMQIAVELDYFAVAENMRGQGIGRQLFGTFVNQVESFPAINKLAFTIVLGEYSKSPLGDMLMKYLLRNGTEAAKQAVALKPTLIELGYPEVIFESDRGAVPTVCLAEDYGFSALGYGRYLGQV